MSSSTVAAKLPEAITAETEPPLAEILPGNDSKSLRRRERKARQRHGHSHQRISIRVADPSDREIIYALRHEVYAAELGQHAENDERVLSDPLDSVNAYLVAEVNGTVAGFVAITPPGGAGFSIDKYFARADLPLVFDSGLYEIRLLTVMPAWRGGWTAPILMYAALRLVQSAGADRIVCIGRSEMVDMYRRAGLLPLGFRTQAGRVTYELMAMDIAGVDADHNATLAELERHVDWRIRGVTFRPGGACYHGGAFFDAIGDEFDRLDCRDTVINADVLDAWFDPAPAVTQSLQSHLPWILRTSPPTGCEGMQRVIAQTRGVGPHNILPGSGSSDLIFLGLRHWIAPSSRVLILDPMYGEYAHVLERLIGCNVDRLALSRIENYVVDPNALRHKLDARYDWVVLVNPNSPTGQHLEREALEAVISAAPASTRFWIDETYVDYAGANCSLERFAAASKNVVICKSMSKMYALSGVRCAYLCGPRHLLEELRPISPPWSVSLPGQIAACEALRNKSYYEERWAATHSLREELAAQLRALGWDVISGCANFLLCHLPPDQPTAEDLSARCRLRGLFIRDAGVMGQCFDDRTIRVAVKDRVTNARIVALLRSCCDVTRERQVVS